MLDSLKWSASAVLLATGLALGAGDAQAQGTIKILYTDPLSGPFAQVGDQNLKQFKYIIDWINGLGAQGVSHVQVRFAARSADELCDQVTRFGEEIGPHLTRVALS